MLFDFDREEMEKPKQRTKRFRISEATHMMQLFNGERREHTYFKYNSEI